MSLLADAIFMALSAIGLMATIAWCHFLASVMEGIYPTEWHVYDWLFIGPAVGLYLMPYLRIKNTRLLQIPRIVTYLATQWIMLQAWLMSRHLPAASSLSIAVTCNQKSETSTYLRELPSMVRLKFPCKVSSRKSMM